MAKTGKGPTGRKRSSPPPKEDPGDPIEHQPIPDPPLNVAQARSARIVLAERSPLSVAFRHIQPNWHHYIGYVELAARKGDIAMSRFRDCYRALSKSTRLRCWPEQICEMAQVAPGELVGAVCRQIWESKAAESSMISSIAHPELLMTTIRLAKVEENFRDRELFFRMAGSLPDRKGTSINIFNQAAGMSAELPDLAGRAKLRTFDEEVIEMSRDLETPDPPFLLKPSEDQDVPPEDH